MTSLEKPERTYNLVLTNSDDSEIFHLQPEAGGKILQSRLRPCMRWRTGMRDRFDVEEHSARLDLCKLTFKQQLLSRSLRSYWSTLRWRKWYIFSLGSMVRTGLLVSILATFIPPACTARQWLLLVKSGIYPSHWECSNVSISSLYNIQYPNLFNCSDSIPTSNVTILTWPGSC